MALDEWTGPGPTPSATLDRNPYLLCVLGQVEAAQGKRVKARKAYDSALRRDPRLAAVWAGRGALAFEEGDHETSIADLTRAIELEESAEALFNRSLALRMAGRAERARADLCGRGAGAGR